MKYKKHSFYLSSVTLILLSFHVDLSAQSISPDEIQNLQEMVGGVDSKAPQNQTIQESQDLSKPKSQAVIKTERDLIPKPTVAKPTNFDSKPAPKKLDTTLKKFGYDLFTDAPTTFAPATDIPIPGDYVIGPGDTIKVILYGGKNQVHDLQVGREGEIYFPEIGPISLAGLSFVEMKNVLSHRIKSQLIGVNISISLGKLRSIRVFILGEAYQPGSYVVSALSTLTNALFISGGVRETGSLRGIELKRQGNVVTKFDFYDLLLNGDTSNDVRLQPGDVIFIPPVGRTAGISGEARRPYVYELKEGESASDLIHYAGGLHPTADLASAQIERIAPSGKGLTLIDVDLTSKGQVSEQLMDGDLLYIFPVLNTMQDVVLFTGYAQRPGFYQWQEGLHITDLIDLKKDLLPQTDRNYVLIKRENNLTGTHEALQLDLDEILQSPGIAMDVELSNRDEIFFFSKKVKSNAIQKQFRNRFVYEEEELDEDESDQGESKSKGSKRLSALLEEAKAGEDLLVKPDSQIEMLVVKGQYIEIIKREQWKVYEQDGFIEAKQNKDLSDKLQFKSDEMQGNRNAIIEPFLELLRQEASTGSPIKTISVGGNVYFPGEYPLTKNMSVSDAIKSGGGLKESTYIDDIELTRKTLINNKYSVTITKISGNDPSALLTAVQANDIVLVKAIPNQLETVEIRGEVFFPGIYPLQSDDTVLTLIARAGGVKKTAFVKGALFQRESIKQAELLRLKQIQDELQREIALSMTAVGMGKEISPDDPINALINIMEKEIDEDSVTGRLVIDLGAILDQTVDDILLEDKDTLAIPKAMQSVSVLGEVYVPSAHVFTKGLSPDDYIELGGGPTQFADMDAYYIIKSDGAIVTGLNSSKFFRGGSQRFSIEPGDTIVVPLRTDQFSSMKTATDITQIIYQMALSVVALSSF